ncbi:hypothetical protein FI667_g5014, partial [Globisporangium splendens]
MWSSHGDKKAQRMKLSEILNAFSVAKANAARRVMPSKIIGFVNAEDHTARVSSTVPVHKPLFEPTPSEVWIDDYTPFHTVTIKLSFRNCDTVARRMKIESPQSSFFKVSPWSPSPIIGANSRSISDNRIDGKIAAGMDIAFQLDFSPQEVKEYTLDLVCCTERERFVVPVRIAPPSAVLEQGAAIQIELTMTPPSLSDRVGELTITDGAGQTAVVQLVGDAASVDVYLSQPFVEPNPTYISLLSRKTVKICNDSEYTLAFSWKSFPDFAHEEGERDCLLDELARMESAELEQFKYEGSDDVSLHPGHALSAFDAQKVIENKYKQIRKAAMEDSMQFVDECFGITPLTGRVWPHSEVDAVVCFSPITALLYSCCAYLEIAGQDLRLPLQIRGKGIGPRAKVVYNELLDFGGVFISDERTRDFTIQNKG